MKLSYLGCILWVTTTALLLAFAISVGAPMEYIYLEGSLLRSREICFESFYFWR